MSTSERHENTGRRLSTADLAAAAGRGDSNRRTEQEIVSSNIQPNDRPSAETQTAATPPEAAAQRQTMARRSENDPVTDKVADDVTDRPQPPMASKSRRVESEQRSTETYQTPSAAGVNVDHGRSASAARPAEVLEPLFTPELAENYRAEWASIQSGFVDDPRQAVRNGDELVAQMMTNLANTFAEERRRVEAQLDETGEGATEDLRVALRRYRSFFERLLSL